MLEAPAQGIDVTVAKLFKTEVEMLVNLSQKTEDCAEGALGCASSGSRPFLPLLIFDFFFCTMGVIKTVGQARIDFIKMFAQKKSHHRRDDRAREKVGSEHGEDHGHGERLKKKSGRAAQEKDRHENDANTESRDKRRHRNL